MRYCPNCGTEVDDNAVFCPTCGQAIDQATETQMPAAPGWPDAPGTERADPPPAEPAAPSAASAADDATRVERQPAAPIAPQPVGSRDVSQLDAGPPTQQADRPARPAVDLPITMPVTLSGWLIGIGALLAALGVLIGLFDGVLNPIDLLLLLGLLVIGAAVFLAQVLPRIPNLQLGTLVVTLIGFGFSLDRLGFRGAGAGELLLFLGTAAAAMGAILLELGRDQPLGPSR